MQGPACLTGPRGDVLSGGPRRHRAELAVFARAIAACLHGEWLRRQRARHGGASTLCEQRATSSMRWERRPGADRAYGAARRRRKPVALGKPHARRADAPGTANCGTSRPEDFRTRKSDTALFISSDRRPSPVPDLSETRRHDAVRSTSGVEPLSSIHRLIGAEREPVIWSVIRLRRHHPNSCYHFKINQSTWIAVLTNDKTLRLSSNERAESPAAWNTTQRQSRS